MQRSTFVRQLLALPALALGLPDRASALDFPTHPVRFVHPLAPGSVADVYWRTIGTMLSRKWGQPVVMENKPGAGGVLAVDYVLRQPPDGHTLFVGGTTQVALAMFNKIAFDPLKDLQLVTMTYLAEIVMATTTQVPANDLAEFVAYAKANPGKLNYASLGKNSVMVYMEWFKRATGTHLTEIPYRGTGEQIEGMLRNDVHLVFLPARTIRPHVESGKLRPLFAISPERLREMPDVPTNAEVGLPDYRPPQWSAFMTSAKVPQEIVQKLRSDIGPLLTSPELEPALAASGMRAFKGSFAEGDELLKYSARVIGDLVRDLKITPD